MTPAHLNILFDNYYFPLKWGWGGVYYFLCVLLLCKDLKILKIFKKKNFTSNTNIRINEEKTKRLKKQN